MTTKPRKNILFLTNRLPFPPDKGDKIRTFHQLSHLAASHDVHCGCFADTPDDVARGDELQRRCRSAIVIPWNRRSAIPQAARGWLRGRPLTESAFAHRSMSRRVAEWSQRIRFDAVVAFSSMMARQALAVPARRHVLDLCDVDSEKWFDYARASRSPLSTICRREGRRLRAWEHTCLNRFDATIVITDRERDLLDPTGRHASLHVIPNGVARCEESGPPASRCGPVVGFLGTMDYRPNVEGACWFVRHAWPAVLRAYPRARMLIIGRRPARRIRRLAKLPGVEVTGEVQDVRTGLARCRVVVAPLHIARGLQNKVLEAMAARRPVVATTTVAAGLRAGPRRPVLIADDPTGFAIKVIDLCRYDGLCQQLAEAGHQFVAAHYNWPNAMQTYERVLLGEPIEEIRGGMPKRSAGMVYQAIGWHAPAKRGPAISGAQRSHPIETLKSPPDITSVQPRPAR